ncbi:MAG: hypothetical protein J0L84_15405 [Verrucomicrobia bacterium]|nr:hypothetical protein [Verrucomicrobiota bacterium]
MAALLGFLLLGVVGDVSTLRAEGFRAAWRGSMSWTSDAISTDTVASEGTLLPHEFQQVAPGYRFSVGLRTNGTLFAWGNVPREFPHHLGGVRSVEIAGYSGLALLENGGVVPLGIDFKPQPALSNVAEIAGAWSGALFRRLDGTLAAWGLEVVEPASPPPVQDAVAIGLHGTLAAALREDGTVMAWDFVSGEVIAVPDSFRGVVQIHLGAGGLYGLRSDGSVAGWGSVAAQIPGDLKGVTSLATGDAFVLALREDGTVVAWGTDDHGLNQVPAGLSRVVAVAASGIGAYAVQADGTVVSWGGAAPLADILSRGVSRIVTDPETDVLISLGRPVDPVITKQPSSQSAHAFQGVRFEVDVTGFGLTYQWRQGQTPIQGATNRVYRIGGLQVGGDSAEFNDYSVTVVNPVGQRVVSDRVRLDVAGTILPGTVVEWGPAGMEPRWVPESIHGRVITADTGAALTAALLSDGSVQSWSTGGALIRRPVPGALRPDFVAAGGTYGLEWSGDGRVASWAPSGRRLHAFRVTGITALSSAEDRVGFLDERGVAWRWNPRSDPASAVVYPVSGCRAVAAARFGIAMLRSDGTVLVEGAQSPLLQPPAGLTNVVALAAGAWHVVALRADGTVVAWVGEEAADVAVPSGLSGVVAITAGDHHTLALRGDGTLVGWGRVATPGKDPGTILWQTYRVPSELRDVSSISAGGVWSSAVLGGAAPPRMDCENVRGVLSAVWHAGASPAVLESAEHLDASRWTVLPDASIREGRWRRTPIPATHAQRFFRLAAP